MTTEQELPHYQCTKKVHALKIAKLQPACGDRVAGPNEETDGGMILTPEEDGYAPFKIDWDYIFKHKPQVGGYYVLYKGGYISWSPADAFEEGYVRI